MKSSNFSRRRVLRGLGVTVALPLLDVMAVFSANAQTAGKTSVAAINRLAYLYLPNGIPRGIWYPEETAADGRLLKLNAWMSPLEPFKEDILIPGNVWTPEGNGHVHGPPTWLTGKDYDPRAVNASHLPIVLAGGGCGTIKSGRYLEHEAQTDFAGIHIALMQRMGVAIDSFGTASTPYEGLEG